MSMDSGDVSSVPPPPPPPPPPGPEAGGSGERSDFPTRVGVERPEKLNRFLPFIKWLLAVPHFFILYALGIVAYVIVFVAFFAILFTKKYPRGLFDFVVNYNRWALNVNAYAYLLMRDEYPPFSWEPRVYPVTLEVDYPEQLNRWLPLVKWLLVFPHVIVLAFLYIAWFFVMLVMPFIILFTAKYPRGLFEFGLGLTRWTTRVNIYGFYLMRDEYPPFSLK